MLCAMCFLPVVKFNQEDPSIRCDNCMLYYHRKCTFLQRQKNAKVENMWLCNHCRRNRINKNSMNIDTPYFFKVEPTDINHTVKLFKNHKPDGRKQVCLRISSVKMYCSIVDHIIRDRKYYL